MPKPNIFTYVFLGTGCFVITEALRYSLKLDFIIADL